MRLARYRSNAAILVAAVASTLGCAEEPPAAASGDEVAAKEGEMGFMLTSTAFEPGGEIPARHTCEGKDISPPLEWREVPEGTRSLVLIVDDPDAPDPAHPRMTWVHWVVYNLPPSAGGLVEGASGGEMPEGSREGLNDWKRVGYGGPCPPIGRHRYFHRLYALDTELPKLAQPAKPAVERAMEGHVLAVAELVGTYQKKR